MKQQETWAELIRRTAERRGVTQYRIAAESGVAQSVLSRFLKGERSITLETAEKLCRVLGLELHEKRAT